MFKIIFVLVLISTIISAFVKINGDKTMDTILTNDHYKFIAINQILMYVSNNGDGSRDPFTGASGFYWPGGKNAIKSSVFADGFIWGGKIASQVRVNGSTYRHGLQAGRIISQDSVGNPHDSNYRVYKIREGWESLPPGSEKDAYQKDYEEWPVNDSAPWLDTNGDGQFTNGVDKPNFIGDEVLWCVSNDLDTSRSKYLFGADPIGLEQQMTVYGYNNNNDLVDVIFKKYILINKGQNIVEDMIFSYWSDPDLGGAGDDYVGCDTFLDLLYCYNADNDDAVYNSPVPAVGYLLLQGPIVDGNAGDTAYLDGRVLHGFKNQKMTSATLYANSSSVFKDPTMGSLKGSEEMYNYMNGKLIDGNPFIDPNTGEEEKYSVSGDPVEGTGWYEGSGWPGGPAPGDRRMVLSSGSFDFAPGNKQIFVVAIIMARGSDHLDSILELKEKSLRVKEFYESELLTSLKEGDSPNRPLSFKLEQNYPNPFNPRTTFEYKIANKGMVVLKIFELGGRELSTLVEEEKQAGSYSIQWDASNRASGVYIYQLSYNGFTIQKKMVLLQ